MNTTRMFHTFASLVMAAFFFVGQSAQAQQTHHRQFVVSAEVVNDSNAHSATAPPPDLYGLQATFTQVNPTIGPNADGSDLWPCFGYGTAFGPNTDCPTLGNPSIPFPVGGVVVGVPQYVWKLQNNTGYGYGNGDGNGNGCDALVNGTTGPLGPNYKPCGQIATWYEDDTNDTTDDLLQRIVVTQGDRIVYDSGTVDYGPAGPSVTYPVTVILSTDANFGFWPTAGEGTGPNNGNCSGDSGYPLTAAANPGEVYVLKGGSTCREPVPGLATFTTSTVLATPIYTKQTGTACTSKGVASPCYTVEWNRRSEIRQDFNIFFE